MATKPKPEEQETAIVQSADNRSEWVVYTDDPYWIKRLDALKAEVIKEYYGGGKTYRLSDKQITVKKIRKTLSADRKAALAAQLKTARESL